LAHGEKAKTCTGRNSQKTISFNYFFLLPKLIYFAMERARARVRSIKRRRIPPYTPESCTFLQIQRKINERKRIEKLK
jgi:hypothetical protein